MKHTLDPRITVKLKEAELANIQGNVWKNGEAMSEPVTTVDEALHLVFGMHDSFKSAPLPLWDMCFRVSARLFIDKNPRAPISRILAQSGYWCLQKITIP